MKEVEDAFEVGFQGDAREIGGIQGLLTRKCAGLPSSFKLSLGSRIEHSPKPSCSAARAMLLRTAARADTAPEA